MENSPDKDLSAKRIHVTLGMTPSKREKKRVRNTSSLATRKPLFSSKSASPVTPDKHSSKSLNRKVSGKLKFMLFIPLSPFFGSNEYFP